jgi:hypothetical protein
LVNVFSRDIKSLTYFSFQTAKHPLSLTFFKMRFISITTAALLGAGSLHAFILDQRSTSCQNRDALAARTTFDIPDPPEPEPIIVTELPLPPVAPSDDSGSCTSDINPNGTGCIAKIRASFQTGNFLPDGLHVVVTMNFTGAPAAPDPANIYSGVQLALVKIDGTTFLNGDSWKCITCGVPATNQVGRNAAMDYPQAFRDGIRALVGLNIVDCGSNLLASPECTPENVFIYPIRQDNKVDGSGPGATIRELRIHPDGVHLGYSSVSVK